MDLETYIVFSTSNGDDLCIDTLMGEYKFHGSMNHGKKIYKRMRIQGDDDEELFLYFWDTRDGPDFAGWWIGDGLGTGGNHTWSRNNKLSMFPPESGWTVPWDGEVKPHMVVTKAHPRQSFGDILDWKEWVTAATEKVAKAEINAIDTIEHAQNAINTGSKSEIAVAVTQITTCAASLAATHQLLSTDESAWQKIPQALKTIVVEMVHRIQQLQEMLQKHQQRLTEELCCRSVSE